MQGMQLNLPVYLFLAALGLLIVVAIVETILGARWNRRYFRTGVPLTTIVIPVDSFHTNLPPVRLLETNSRSCLLGSLAFREIAPDAYGFRFRTVQLALPLRGMHGGLAFDRADHCVILRSFLNLTDMALALFVLAVVALVSLTLTTAASWQYGMLAFGVVALVLLLEVVALRVNRRRCLALATFAAAAWARQYGPPLLPPAPPTASNDGPAPTSDRARARRVAQSRLPPPPPPPPPEREQAPEEEEGEDT